MSLLCRNVWGRLAILAAITIALAACGAGPGAKAQPDPVKIPDVSRLDIGKTHNVSLVNKFSGEGLTYTAKSSDTAVATVEVDNAEDILTVTAVGEGKATITVTAADSQDRTASQTFKVTVPKPTTSEPEPGAPTVRTGAPGSFDVDQGDTQTVTLSRVFTGEDLEFTVASNDTDVATASEDAGILTITARSPGDATITVTATNDDGNAVHRIAVTVPAPVTTTPEPETPATNNPSNCPSPLTIPRDGNAKCTLHDAAYSLSVSARSKEDVSVGRPSAGDKTNTWTITAHKKGEHIVYVNDGGDPVGRIDVIVPNTGPNKKMGDPDKAEDPLLSPTPTGTTTTPQGSTTTVGLKPVTFFSDVDDIDNCPTETTDDPTDDPCAMVTAGNGAFRYKISDKPEGLLIDTKDGFIVVKATATDTITMEAVVLTPLKDDFHIELYAYDRDNAPSDNPVKFTFGAILPYIGHYSVDQATNGKVATIKGVEKALRIGNRLDVPHEITVTGDAFTVATEKIADLNPVSGKVRVNPNSPPDGAGALCNADFSIPKWSSSTALGEECYSIASSSASILKITGFSVTNKIITFQLPSKNRSVSATGKPVITITYHVWALSSGIDGTTEPFPTTGRTRVTAAMKIPVDIHRCTVTSACLLVAE